MRAEEETSSLKYAATNGTKVSAPAQYLSYESIKNQCWWHQSTTNTRSHSSYCEEHQYQCAEHLQAIHKALTSNERKINISALSININAKSIKSQCTEHQHAKHSVFKSKAHSVSVQSTLCLQPLNATLTSMHLASISMLRVSITNAQNINQSINMQSIQCL